jgi:hypothetical protein
MSRRLFVAIALPAIMLCASAHAQDRGANQAAALFQQSCVRFTGRSDLLRDWVKAHGLPQASPDLAAHFSGGRPALMFGAGTADGKMALVSEDDGSCRVVVEHEDAAGVENALVAILQNSGVTVSSMSDRAKPGTTQRLYSAAIGSRRWLLSVTSHEHADAPATPPEIVLLATVADGQAPSKQE